MNFVDFKQESCLQVEDCWFEVFGYDHMGATENDFFDWVGSQARIRRKYEYPRDSGELDLPSSEWQFMLEQYTRQARAKYLVAKFPDGFFEAMQPDDPTDVVCFLPEPGPRGRPYRLSYYRANGPIHHAVYRSREEALEKIARQGYVATEGALDALEGTDDWYRGLFIARWAQLSNDPRSELEKHKSDPEVRRLFNLDEAV